MPAAGGLGWWRVRLSVPAAAASWCGALQDTNNTARSHSARLASTLCARRPLRFAEEEAQGARRCHSQDVPSVQVGGYASNSTALCCASQRRLRGAPSLQLTPAPQCMQAPPVTARPRLCHARPAATRMARRSRPSPAPSTSTLTRWGGQRREAPLGAARRLTAMRCNPCPLPAQSACCCTPTPAPPALRSSPSGPPTCAAGRAGPRPTSEPSHWSCSWCLELPSAVHPSQALGLLLAIVAPLPPAA